MPLHSAGCMRGCKRDPNSSAACKRECIRLSKAYEERDAVAEQLRASNPWPHFRPQCVSHASSGR